MPAPARPAAPRLTARPGALSPAVEIHWPTLPAGTVRMDVWRGTRLVRGGKGVKPGPDGSLTLLDYEAPFGEPAIYYGDAYSADGLFTRGVAGGVVLNVDEVWFSDPYAPRSGIRVELAAAALSEKTYTSGSALLDIYGSTEPVLIHDARNRPSNVPLDVVTKTREEADRLRALLIQADPVLVRTPKRLPFGTAYVHFTSLRELPRETHNGPGITRLVVGELTRWELVGTTVARPTANIVIDPPTFKDLTDSGYKSWQELLEGKPTWRDVYINPRKPV